MKHKIVMLIAAVVLIIGCSKETPQPTVLNGYEPSSTAIAFNTEDNWGSDNKTTKAAEIINKFKDGDKIAIYGYYLAGNEASITHWSEDAVPNFMHNQELNYNGNSWSYSPTKYWPNNNNDRVSFISVYPYNGIGYNSNDAEKYSFKYESNPFADNNSDLMMGSVLNAQKSENGVELNMKHLLTRINIEVAAINALTIDADGQTHFPDGSNSGEYDVTYAVNGIIFNDILMEGEVKVDESDGTFSWEVDKSSKLYVSATQGNTLRAYEDEGATLKTTTTKKTKAGKYTYNSVCKPGKAIFVMPQSIENNEYGTQPTVQLMIRKSYTYYSTVYHPNTALSNTANSKGEYPYKGEVIYVPNAVPLPTPNEAGWKMGENITMRFAFDISGDNPMPLTVLSMIYEYSDVNIDINVNHNVYIYSNKNDVIRLESNQSEAEMNFYTNYSYDLTKPHSQEELDGTKTTSNGLVFFSDSDGIKNNNHWIPVATGETDGNGYAKYKVTNSKDSNYSFYYWLKKSTRGDEGCYIGPDSMDINQDADDEVYLLRLVVNDKHLAACNQDGTLNNNGEYGVFSGNIGVEMLSNAGGMITKLFPIKVIKKKGN